MDLSQNKNTDFSSPFLPPASSDTSATSTSHYLKVPRTRPSRFRHPLPGPNASDISDSVQTSTDSDSTFDSIPPIVVPPRKAPVDFLAYYSSQARLDDLAQRVYMSISPVSSVGTDFSVCSSPPARSYRVPRFPRMSESRRISEPEKQQYIRALQTHQINTLVDLRRIEKAFAVLGTPDCSQSMTSAWSYYVDSNGLLTELRGLTENYPFSSDCLDEAKRRVFCDPESNRSWNLCWLVLSKVQDDQLIPYYARYQASQPAMWGQHTPSSDEIDRLANAFATEWQYALGQFLRHWDQPPAR